VESWILWGLIICASLKNLLKSKTYIYIYRSTIEMMCKKFQTTPINLLVVLEIISKNLSFLQIPSFYFYALSVSTLVENIATRPFGCANFQMSVTPPNGTELIQVWVKLLIYMSMVNKNKIKIWNFSAEWNGREVAELWNFSLISIHNLIILHQIYKRKIKLEYCYINVLAITYLQFLSGSEIFHKFLCSF